MGDCGLVGACGTGSQVGAPVGLNADPHTVFTDSRPSGHDALSAYGKYAGRGTNAYAASEPKDRVSYSGCPLDDTFCHTLSCLETHGTLALLKHPAIHWYPSRAHSPPVAEITYPVPSTVGRPEAEYVWLYRS